MNLLIAGGSGFIGKALINSLQNEHQITVIGRDKRKLHSLVTPNVSYILWDELTDLNPRSIDCIINLCGHNIANSRWSNSVKQQLIASRVETTQRLIHWAIQNQAKPHFICANAVGIYGIQSPNDLRELDEDTPLSIDTPPDFLHEIGMRWQAAVLPAQDNGMPVTTVRFGVVIKKNQGMLGKLQLSFALGLGSILGSGQQLLSWIHLDDVVDALRFLINQPHLTGPFNLTAPQPISQAEFAHTLARCMHRPLWLRLPATLVRTLLGEMGECLLLSGQRVVPKRLLAAGYTFHYPTITDALTQEFSN